MQPKKKILFICHEATLTGAPILLLNLITLVKTEFEIEIVLKRGGDIEKQFAKLAPTYILKHKNYSKEKKIFKKLVDRLVYFLKQLSILLPYSKADLIFSNTVCNGRILKRFNFFKKPIFTYVHELESMLQYFNQWNDTKFSLELSTTIFYPSTAVQKNLINQYQIKSSKTIHLPYYFPQDDFNVEFGQKALHKKLFLEKLSIPENAFLVVGMGMVSKRKGTQHFIDVAEKVIQKKDHIYFIWIGDFSEEAYAQQIKEDFFINKKSSKILFTGKLPYSTKSLLPFDLFFLSSVEDPYPLVVLEAAYQFVPTICYENSGGITEFIANDFGFKIENNNIGLTVNKIIEIASDLHSLNTLSCQVRDRVITLHSDSKKIMDTFKKAIEKL